MSDATTTKAPAPQSAAAPSPFPPIADYAFLSNCHTGALVAPDGAIDWLCVPSFDSPSVFGSLLDRAGGVLPARRRSASTIRPRACTSPGRTSSSTTWKTPTGWIVVRDALTMGPRGGEDTITPHTRPPADDDGDHMLVRTVECIDGQVEVELVCEPAFDYGREPAEWALVDGDLHAADASGAGQTFRLRSDLALGIEGNRVRARHVLKRGERAFCALSWAEELAAPVDVEEADDRIARHDPLLAVVARHGRASPTTAGATRSSARRSTIKGLTYMPTGATVAALTTSLPETPGGERNWDYRYTWMRDTTFTLQALHWLNLDWEADEFMQFVADLEPNEDGALQIMYGIDGRRDLTESTLDDLTGYAGARPVRDRQRRVRPAPERRLSARCSTRSSSTRITASASPADCGRSSSRRPSARAACGRSRTRASGRHAASRSTTSRRSSCAGSRSTGRPSSPRSAATRELGASWRATAEEIRADILEHGVSDRGVLRQHYDTDALDASVLLGAIFEFLPADDERLHSTVLAIADELTENGFVLRYRTEETDDGLSGKEGTFLICSFWLVSALAIVGELQQARDLMERLLRIASPLGLYAEEFDVRHWTAPRQLPAGVLASRADGGRRTHRRPRTARPSIGRAQPEEEHGRLRRDHHRHRRRRRHARAPPRALREEHPPSRARRLAAARTGELGHGRRLRRQPLRLPRHVVRREAARRSSRRSTTSSAARRSCTAPRSTGCASRTSGSSATTTASRRRGRSPTTSSSRTTRSPSTCTRCTARAARTRPSRRLARRTHSRRSPTSRGSSSCTTTSPRPATTRSTRPRGASERREPCLQRLHPLLGRATASPASSTPSRMRRSSACGPRSSTTTSRC